MKVLISSMLVLLGISAYGQLENSLLWKISNPKSKKISYLYGTMHTRDSMAHSFGTEMLNAFNSCKVVACEIDFTNAEMQSALLGSVIMKNNELKDLYNQEEWKVVKNGLSLKLDPIMLMAANKMKPFYIIASLSETGEDSGFSLVDEHLLEMAKDSGKKTVGLETPEEALLAIDEISLEEQADMLFEMLSDIELLEEQEAMLFQLYYEQDLDKMFSFSIEYEMPEKFQVALVTNRNNYFTDRLIVQMKKHEVFCAIGAMHLPGNDGLINQLRARGYKVEPVFFSWGQ